MNQLLSNRPRLLYVITQGHWGGAQKYVYDLATALTGQFEVTIAVGDPEGAKDLQQKISDRRYAINFIQLHRLRRSISPLHDLLAIFELKKLYQTVKPDLVHLNSSKAGILGSLATITLKSEICNLKLIYTAHGWVFEEPLPWPIKALYRILERWTARWKDKIIVLSADDERTARETLGVPAHKLTRIPNGIPPGARFARSEARAALGLLAQPLIIGTIANHYKTKGLDILLQAAAELKKEINDLQVVIMGDGPERPRLEAMIESLALGLSVKLTGFRPEAAQMLLAFDIFVLPSRKEGFPYTLLEAMQAGLPIIATTVGAVPSVIADKIQGLLVPPNSADSLCRAIKTLAFNAAKRQMLAQAAKEKAVEFSLNRQIESTTTRYQSLLPPTAGSH